MLAIKAEGDGELNLEVLIGQKLTNNQVKRFWPLQRNMFSCMHACMKNRHYKTLQKPFEVNLSIVFKLPLLNYHFKEITECTENKLWIHHSISEYTNFQLTRRVNYLVTQPSRCSNVLFN